MSSLRRFNLRIASGFWNVIADNPTGLLFEELEVLGSLVVGIDTFSCDAISKVLAGGQYSFLYV